MTKILVLTHSHQKAWIKRSF